MARKLIAGNWKMNGLLAGATALAGELAARAKGPQAPVCDFLVCPPAQLLFPVAELLEDSGIALGAQDCHWAQAGAHTGDISAAMLADTGCSHVILGHSERRSDHGESSAQVKAKAEAAQLAGLTPIICVGETAEERKAGEALQVIEAQLRESLPEVGDVVIAYEPVWAIGTGLTATPGDVAEAHAHIHGLLATWHGGAAADATPVLYGGSVKPENAAELLAVDHVGGALVGGASLKALDFWAIGEACS